MNSPVSYLALVQYSLVSNLALALPGVLYLAFVLPGVLSVDVLDDKLMLPGPDELGGLQVDPELAHLEDHLP